MTKNQILSRLRAKGHITEEEYQLLKEDRPTGKWIFDESRHQYVCSNCNEIPTMWTGCALDLQTLSGHYLYCRACGTKIVGWEKK